MKRLIIALTTLLLLASCGDRTAPVNYKIWYHWPERFLPDFSSLAEPDLQGTKLNIDLRGIDDTLNHYCMLIEAPFKVKTEEDYSTLEINLSGVRDTGIVVQLLNGSDAVVRQQRVSGNSTKFLYVNPGKYYIRAFVDANGNNLWDTGDYDADRQPEAVYYYHQETECKAKWDVKRDWDLAAQPRYQQKPLAITKQKPDQQKKLKNRNLERAKQLGIEYIQDKTGMKL